LIEATYKTIILVGSRGY